MNMQLTVVFCCGMQVHYFDITCIYYAICAHILQPAVPPPSSQPPVTSADTTTNHPLTCAVTTIPHVSHIHHGLDATSDDDGHSLAQSVDSSGGSGVPAHEHIPVTTRTKVLYTMYIVYTP